MSSLRTKLGLGALGLVLVAGGATGVLNHVPSASAHDQAFTCTSNVAHLRLANYPAGSTVVVSYDGAVVDRATFGPSTYAFEQKVDPSADHTLAASVVGSDGVGTRELETSTATLCSYTAPVPTGTPTPPVVTPTPTGTPTPPVVTPKPTPTTPVVTPKPTPTHTPGGTPSPTPTRTPAHSTAPTPKPAVTHPAATSPKPSPSGSATVPAAAPRTTSTPSAVAAGTGQNTPRTGELAFTGAEGVIGGSIAAAALLALGTMLIVAHRRAARRVRG